MRYLTSELCRFLAEERKMAFIVGPRQVGKTTLAKSLLQKSAAKSGYFNWDIARDRTLLIKQPEGFWRTHDLSFPRIVLDEIHKFPRWKRFLKGLYDDVGKELEIIVTGSGRLDIYQRGGDSLFGRYGLYHLHPFTVGEIVRPSSQSVLSPEDFWNTVLERKKQAGADEALNLIEKFTGFPEPLFAENERRFQRWKRTHHNLIIREDLRDLTRIREIGLIESLVTLLPGRVGSPLSFNSLREDLQVAFATVKNWIEVLSRLYYVFSIRPYAEGLARTLHKEPKVYLYEFSDIESEGARFENVVALHLLKLCDVWNEGGFGDFELRYVRTKEKKEVDFLITQRRRPYALIEAKLTDKELDPSLRYFSDRLKPQYTIQVVRNSGEKKLWLGTKDIHILTASNFLSYI